MPLTNITKFWLDSQIEGKMPNLEPIYAVRLKQEFGINYNELKKKFHPNKLLLPSEIYKEFSVIYKQFVLRELMPDSDDRKLRIHSETVSALHAWHLIFENSGVAQWQENFIDLMTKDKNTENSLRESTTLPNEKLDGDVERKKWGKKIFFVNCQDISIEWNSGDNFKNKDINIEHFLYFLETSAAVGNVQVLEKLLRSIKFILIEHQVESKKYERLTEYKIFGETFSGSQVMGLIKILMRIGDLSLSRNLHLLDTIDYKIEVEKDYHETAAFLHQADVSYTKYILDKLKLETENIPKEIWLLISQSVAGSGEIKLVEYFLDVLFNIQSNLDSVEKAELLEILYIGIMTSPISKDSAEKILDLYLSKLENFNKEALETVKDIDCLKECYMYHALASGVGFNYLTKYGIKSTEAMIYLEEIMTDPAHLRFRNAIKFLPAGSINFILKHLSQNKDSEVSESIIFKIKTQFSVNNHKMEDPALFYLAGNFTPLLKLLIFCDVSEVNLIRFFKRNGTAIDWHCERLNNSAFELFMGMLKEKNQKQNYVDLVIFFLELGKNKIPVEYLTDMANKVIDLNHEILNEKFVEIFSKDLPDSIIAKFCPEVQINKKFRK